MMSDKRLASNHRRKMMKLKDSMVGLSAEWGEIDGGVERAFERLASAVDEVISELRYAVCQGKGRRLTQRYGYLCSDSACYSWAGWVPLRYNGDGA